MEGEVICESGRSPMDSESTVSSKKKLLIYVSGHAWIFIAAQELSLVAESGDTLLIEHLGSSR